MDETGALVAQKVKLWLIERSRVRASLEAGIFSIVNGLLLHMSQGVDN